MKCVVISDTHGQHSQLLIPQCDLLIHCGDFCNRGDEHEVMDFMGWLKDQPAQVKVFIAGNHDIWCEGKASMVRTLARNRGLIYLCHSEEGLLIEDKPYHIFGSPYTPQFGNWAFMANDEDLFARWESLNSGIDILITHGPPRSMMDVAPRRGQRDLPLATYRDGYHAGDLALEHRISRLRTPPRYHFFGHLHENYGITEHNRTVYGNAALLDNQYRLVNLPLEVEIS